MKDILKIYLEINHFKGNNINDVNYTDYIYNFIMYEFDKYYVETKYYRDLMNKYVNTSYFHKSINELKLPSRMTYYKYFKLLRRTLILYHKSFNIDFDINCPPVKNYTQTKENKTSGFINSDNMYISFIMDRNNKELYPLVVGSYNIDNHPDKLLNKSIIYIFNICSNVNDINKIMGTEYKTDKLLKYMFEHFSIITGYVTLALAVENNNPWFTKAFSLYYNIGFVPLLDTIDTGGSILDSMYGCDVLLSNSSLYNNCKEQINKKMLMMITKSKIDFILYYPHELTNNVMINRHEPFYDSVLAFAYRCSCFFDEYYRKNYMLCKQSIVLFNEFFSDPNNADYKIDESYGKVQYFKIINGYIDDINMPNSVVPDYYKKIVTENQDLYRFLATTVGNIYTLDHSDTIKYINPKYKISLMKSIANNNNAYTYYIDTNNAMYSTVENNNYRNQNYYYSINDLYNNMEKDLENHIYVNKYDNILITNITEQDNLIFIPCSYNYIDSQNKNNNIMHVISLVYNKYNKELYHYDSEIINVKRTPQDKIAYEFMLKYITLMLKFNNCDVNNIIDLTEYIFPNGNKIYHKIQKGFADDEKGSLCSLLSHIPYIALNLIDPNKNILNQLKFYVWYIYFTAILFKRNYKHITLINNLQSNIMIAFPYLYLNIYKIIKRYVDGLNTFLIDNNDESMSTNQNNIDIMNQLTNIYDNLLNNINELNKRIQDVVNDPEEIPSRYYKYY